jgi:hypothetical protein
MLFSIIIVNYRTPEITADCLRSLFRFYDPTQSEIIVVDNASGDDSPDKLRQEFGEQIRLIENGHNAGFGAANNRGAAVAKGNYLFFLNSDTIIKDNIFNKLAEVLGNLESSRPEIGVFGPRLLGEDGREQAGAAGANPSLYGIIAGKLAGGRQQISDRKMGGVNQTKPTKAVGASVLTYDWISGAALIISRRLFDAIGGWDENFFLYFEDADLCRRAKQKGRQAALLNDIKIIHRGGQSFPNSRQQKKYYYQSQNYYWKKYYGPTTTTLMKIIRWPYKLSRLSRNNHSEYIF